MLRKGCSAPLSNGILRPRDKRRHLREDLFANQRAERFPRHQVTETSEQVVNILRQTLNLPTELAPPFKIVAKINIASCSSLTVSNRTNTPEACDPNAPIQHV